VKIKGSFIGISSMKMKSLVGITELSREDKKLIVGLKIRNFRGSDNAYCA